MPTNSLVSIMMPAYNAEKYIQQSIESVLAQTYPYWELIVVNDGSADRTAEIISGYHDPRIKLYNQPNGGESSARNTALKQVKGEFLAFLDSDDLYLPEHLEGNVTFLKNYPEFGGVYSDGYYIDEHNNQLKTLSSRRRGPFQGDIFEEMVRSSDVFGAPLCVMLRREVISHNSLDFDTDIIIGPDWDFFIRYSQVSSFGYYNQLTCCYRVHQSNISIRTGMQRRLLSLAKCREKAIKLPRFRECSVQTRVFIFYDLLINLLTGFPERQVIITQWTEFTNLPMTEQARLYRLMAFKALLNNENNFAIKEWLHISFSINPKDLRQIILNLAYKLSPQFCLFLIKLKSHSYSRKIATSPFRDLF